MIREVAYELALPPMFSPIHPVFHVSTLRGYVPHESHVLQYDGVELDDCSTFVEEPIAIFAKDVRRLRSRAIPMVKVRWRRRAVKEATWETEHDMLEQFPGLFDFKLLLESYFCRRKSFLVVDVGMTFRHFRSRVGWFKTTKPRLRGTNLIQEALDQSFFPRVAHEVHDEIWEAGKLSPRYWAFRDHLDDWGDGSPVLQYNAVEFDDCSTFVEELAAILTRDVRLLCPRAIPVVKVDWRHHPVEEATSETEHDMREQLPGLFEPSSTS
ncbi:hypothetical protein MTR67_011862 [Solanum verrucosum]|uniref:Tf2-1-like SH3-like domain-containing protein n=1 Tax=Solanum verrucosum TaxID=315347 RepID=A0AAF0Q7N4_SOLVR|nr:hypothetical protein MTR67_011862 [Solanum verrucosum]